VRWASCGIAALALGTLACGSSAPTSTTSPADGMSGQGEAIDVVSTFADGAVYEVRNETGTHIDSNAIGTTDVRVVVDSRREVKQSGIFHQSSVQWRESVQRVRVLGERSWDSASTEPPSDDLVELAALVGARYLVTIDALGVAKTTELEVPMARLTPAQREGLSNRIGNLEKVASGLAASVATSLASLPHRRFRVGERWTHERANPSIGKDAVVRLTWTLEELSDGVARFAVAGAYRASNLQSSKVSGSAEYDLARRLFRVIEMTTELELPNAGGKVVTHSRVEVAPSKGNGSTP